MTEELQARSDRVVSKRTPVNDEEIYTLVSKRLFKTVDPAAAQQAARMYRAAYDRTKALYDPTIFSSEYSAAQVAAYPIHPELVDVLYKKWSTASDFPRTRAVLQLLASIVADQWVNRREAYTIQSAHVNLERERIRTRIVSAAGAGGGYDAVVAADIIGGDAHADMLDERQNGDYERHHVARGIATTLLMHSFGGATRVGALPPELRLGTVAPNVGPEYVSEILESLEQTLWYVHREGERLRFQTKANIYRIIAQSADGQPGAVVAERLRDALGTAIGTAVGFRVLERGGADGTIADRPDSTIAVLDPKYGVSQENGAPLTGREAVDQLWEKSGGGLRQWRNALVLVAPDTDLWRRTEEAMREVMAYESVIAEAEKGRLEASQLELRELRSRFNDKKESLRTSITTAFRWVLYPDEDGLAVLPLPMPATKDERIASRAIARLSDQNYGQPKVLTKMGAVYFNSKIAPRLWKDESTSPLDLGEASRRFPQWTFLPILPDRESTLRICVREGIKDHLWALAIGDNSSLEYRRLIESPDDLDTVVSLFDGSASLVKGELLDVIRGELRKSDPVDGGGGTVVDPGPISAPPLGVGGQPQPAPVGGTPVIPVPSKRHRTVRLSIAHLGIGKTSNLQPYLFKVLQEQDAGAELSVAIDVTSSAGVSEEVLEKRIVEAFDQLGIEVRWESG
ncbi:MAG: ATPase [Chloroflexi bacterium]|nr:ATPase [Chloroflexota bacterium]